VIVLVRRFSAKVLSLCSKALALELSNVAYNRDQQCFQPKAYIAQTRLLRCGIVMLTSIIW